MRYHYKASSIYLAKYGELYECDHPVYSKCTLFKINKRGLAVIQQHYNAWNKTTWWCEIDACLTDDLYLNPGFKEYFNKRAKECTDGIYPTVSVRQIMWALKMKPIKRERWETCFDRRNV